MKSYRLLLSARDHGAALQIGAIAQQATKHSLFDVTLVAMQPAYETLKMLDLDPMAFNVPISHNSEGKSRRQLLTETERLLNAIQPNAVLTGLSGHTIGIDEAIIHCAGTIPSYTFQDYWGDVNARLDSIADCYFTLDPIAASLTQQRHQAQTCVSGSPKYASYGQLDPLEMRRVTREALGIKHQQRLIGFFGQPIDPQREYLESVRQFSRSMAVMETENKVLYRPHPSESSSSIAATLKIFKENKIDLIVAPKRDILSLLSACDNVCSLFSSCNLDNIYLNYFSERPLATSIYLQFSDELTSLHHAQTGLNQPPVIELGLAEKCKDENELVELLHQNSSTQQAYWRNIHDKLPNPCGAASIILNRIIDDLEK